MPPFPRRILVPGLLALTLLNRAGAKDMEEATWEKAVAYPTVVVAEYTGYDAKRGGSYLGGVAADFKVIQVLKGKKLPATIQVRYLFHDLSACTAPKDWKLSEKEMPKPGAKCLLFLRPAEKPGDAYTTYRGSFGCKAATDANLEQARKLLGKPLR